MQKTQPIRNTNDIQRFKQYYLDRQQIRNYTMVTLGMNTSLRIGDLLNLKWKDVYDFQNICFLFKDSQVFAKTDILKKIGRAHV